MRWWTLLITIVSAVSYGRQTSAPPRLLIISLDGFWHEYLNTYSLPAFNQFRTEGVYATQGMRPTFTTMTFPNHMSMATGMYPEDHGIVHNTFVDRLLKKTISMASRDEGQWADPKVEPLWITATRQNKKTAVLSWPASHNQFNGTRPLIYSWSYTEIVPLREKIDNALSYFRQLHVQLVMLYHHEPDKEGHISGLNSTRLRKTLLRLDKDIAYLLAKVKSDLDDDLDIMIVSDHGMTQVKQVIRPFFDGYLDRSMVKRQILSGAFLNVIPRRGRMKKVMKALRRIPNVTVYTRDKLPDRLHYSKPNYRLGEIFVIPNEEGIILLGAKTNVSYTNKGGHGWDNTLVSMQAIFMARGPSFNQDMNLSSLNNVDIYPIACRILEISPNSFATAGSLDNLTDLFHVKIRHLKNRYSSSSLVNHSLPLLLLLSFILNFRIAIQRKQL